LVNEVLLSRLFFIIDFILLDNQVNK